MNEAEAVARATALATECRLPLVEPDESDCDLLLVVRGAGLELTEVGSGAAGGVRADFDAGGANARRIRTASRRQPLARAIGLKGRSPTVVDATAGLGRDTMLLAHLGCHVLAAERSIVLATMLRDALDRAELPPPAHGCEPGSIRVRVGDARTLLAGASPGDAPDVVYVDPMFPASGKSALPKKEMRILRRLVGDDLDASDLLATARRVATDRVVVKRPPRAAPLADTPTMSYEGKLARYDVYFVGG